MIDRSIVNAINPFIFSNSLESWPALGLWSPLYFKKKFGNLEFNVNPNLPNKICPYFYNAKLYHALMKLSDFIDLMSKNKSCYLAQEDMAIFKDLKEDYNFYDPIPPANQNHSVSINLWIG